jgi:chemotaxis signal transduction protein
MNGASRLEKLSVEQLAVLRERAREAAVATEEDDRSDEFEVLEVQSRDQTFALPLNSVEGITDLVSLAAVPRPSSLIRGLVSFRGEVLVGVELASLFGHGSVGVADLRRIVVVASGGNKIAVLTEKALSVGQRRAKTFLASSGTKKPFVVGTNERFVTLLDSNALVTYVLAAIQSEPA